jgi:hypothetical protein
MRWNVDEEYWCMQWSSEIFPEAAMIPDLGVFLRSAINSSQTIPVRGQLRIARSPSNEVREALLAQAREKFPARLRLPFLLSPPGENKVQAAEPREALLVAHSEKR